MVKNENKKINNGKSSEYHSYFLSKHHNSTRNILKIYLKLRELLGHLEYSSNLHLKNESFKHDINLDINKSYEHDKIFIFKNIASHNARVTFKNSLCN